MTLRRRKSYSLVSISTLALIAALSFAQPHAWADDAKPPIPVPDDASDLNYTPDSDSGTLEFNSATAPKDVAAFYKDAMKKAGWKETPSVIHNDNMQVLDFSKGGKELELTIMKMGDQTMVNGTGEGLAGTPAQSADSSDSGSGSNDVGAPKTFTAEDKDGYPIPSDHSSAGSESSIFRKSVMVTTEARVQDLVAFYENELPKKGFTTMSEHTAPDNALPVYDTPNGPLSVAIKQEGDNATATLSISDKAAASKSPLFPKPGQVKIGLGNINPGAVDVTVNGKKIKVPGGAGSKSPDGPTLDVAPGDIKVEMKGGDPVTVTAGPDQIWLVMVGPGGLLPIQAY